jgi:hypothetical protein
MTDIDFTVLTTAYQMLKDLGLGLDDGDFTNSNFEAMKQAVQVVHQFGSRLPPAIQVKAIEKYFFSFRNLEKFTDVLRPSMEKQMRDQLITEEREQQLKKEARLKALQKTRDKERLDAIIDTDPPPADPYPKQQVPDRETLFHMCLSLQKQIKDLQDQTYALEEWKRQMQQK